MVCENEGIVLVEFEPMKRRKVVVMERGYYNKASSGNGF